LFRPNLFHSNGLITVFHFVGITLYIARFRRWTMSAMLRKYGDELFNVSLIPYAETFGKRSLPPEHRLVRDLPNFTQSGRLSVR
jgi:hypothetical protein